MGANTPDLRSRSLKGRATVGTAHSLGGQETLPNTIELAFVPDAVTALPGTEIKAKALTYAGSNDNNPLYGTVNWIIKA